MVKKFTLPELPYAYNALEPVISEEIMKLHHQKHHAAYVNNLNAALEKYATAESEENLDAMINLQPAIRFNGGGHINHSLFWENLAPQNSGGGQLPKGDLADHLKQTYGSVEKFIEKFNAQVGPLQGSGWGWLGYCKDSKILSIVTTHNQDPLLATQSYVPLLGIDVWEHAYYLQYKNVRPDYLKAIWSVVNWAKVEERYANACSLALSGKSKI